MNLGQLLGEEEDIQKNEDFPNACKDSNGRLRVAAAIGVSGDAFERASELANVDIDAIVIDTAHGHSRGVLETISKIKHDNPNIAIIAGNVATGDGTKALIDSGVDCVKVGIGAGASCTTRVIAGVGVPQLTAIMDAVDAAKEFNIPIIADGGLRYSGDIAKALAAGADSVMVGSLLAGMDESPGETILYEGRQYKSYRGMGSMGAMEQGSGEDDTIDRSEISLVKVALANSAKNSAANGISHNPKSGYGLLNAFEWANQVDLEFN